MRYYNKKRNTSSDLLLKRFTNKKSGKVEEARKEIKARFDYLDWSVQKRILYAFLSSGKTDRAWAYAKLLRYWDDCFIPVIESLWNQNHEIKCSWPIIRHFPEEYVSKNLDLLSNGDNYYFICRRLAHHPGFHIDRSRLTITEYLSVLNSAGRRIDMKDALDTLFELVGYYCSVGVNMIDIACPIPIIRLIGLNPMDIRGIRRAMRNLDEMGCKDVLGLFKDWCNDVAEKIRESSEFINLNNQPISDMKYVSRLSDISVVYMYLSLPLSIMSKLSIKCTPCICLYLCQLCQN